MSDIILELRVPTMCYDMVGKCYTQSTMEEAADYIEKLEAKLAAAEADIQRLVSEAVEREALFQAERERVRVLRAFVYAFVNAQKAHYGDATETHIAMIDLARDAAEALDGTEPEDK